MQAVNAYQQTQKQTASRERLMVMLFQAAERQMMQASQALRQLDQGLEKKQAALDAIERASAIVLELWGTLDEEKAPELVQSLVEIYELVSGRLTRAMIHLDAIAVDEALKAFAPIVEAFTEAVGHLEEAA